VEEETGVGLSLGGFLGWIFSCFRRV